MTEILTGKPQETYQSAAMLNGIEREPEARAAYSFAQNIDVEEIGLIRHPTISRAHASPDGLIGNDGLVEIKCMQPAGHLNILLTDAIDDRYLKQAMFQMACSERKWVDFVAYSPEFPSAMQLFIKRIPRDDKLIAEIEAAVRIFLAEVGATVDALCERYPLTEAA